MSDNLTKKHTDSMNEELKQWLLEAEQKGDLPDKIKEASEKGKSKRLSKCSVCGEKTGKAVCIKCGKPVCTACYFHIVGLCKKCISKDVVDRWKEERPDWEKTLGVKWID